MKNKVVLSGLFLLLYTIPFIAQDNNQDEIKFHKMPVFTGEIVFNEGTQPVSSVLEIHEFIIDGGQRISDLRLPKEGIFLIQLKGGELATIINGERQERNVNEFWVVDAATQMEYMTEDDSAILKIYVLDENYQKTRANKSISSSVTLEQSNFSELTENLFARTAHIIGNPNNPIATVIDMNVGPGLITDPAQLAGPVQLQVISGSTNISVNDKQEDLALGGTTAIGEGEEFIIDNRNGQAPVKLRAMVFPR